MVKKQQPVQTISSKKKAGTSSPSATPKGMKEGPIKLGRKSAKNDPVKIGTLSWGLQGAADTQTEDSFVASLKDSSAALGSCDLIVAAGLTLDRLPDPKKVLLASKNVPVLFEAMSGKDSASWYVVRSSKGSAETLLSRSAQMVVTSADDPKNYQALGTILSAGAGVIEFEGVDQKFVLFICGENNALAYGSQKSVLIGMPKEETRQKQTLALLGSQWVVINPSHNPYWPQAIPMGFAKVGAIKTVRGMVGPTLGHLVARSKPSRQDAKDGYKDGSNPPASVIHVNNFSLKNTKTHNFAAVGFIGSGKRVPPAFESGVVQVAGADISWRATSFEVPAN